MGPWESSLNYLPSSALMACSYVGGGRSSNPSRGIGGADGGTYDGAVGGGAGGATQPSWP